MTTMLGWLDELPAAKAEKLRVEATPKAMAHVKIFSGIMFSDVGGCAGET